MEAVEDSVEVWHLYLLGLGEGWYISYLSHYCDKMSKKKKKKNYLRKCFSCFQTAMTKHYDQSDLQKKAFS